MTAFVSKWASKALEGLLGSQGRSAKQSRCTACATAEAADSPMYRCFHSQTPAVLCKQCILKAHKSNPWHFVEEWDTIRRFWKRMPLTALGVTIDMGHQGARCQHARAEARTMTIVSDNGIHEVDMHFCWCPDPVTGAYTPEATQLLLHGYWPSTWERPTTAFTTQVMREFTHLANQATVTAYDYFEILRRKTDSIATHTVTVRVIL